MRVQHARTTYASRSVHDTLLLLPRLDRWCPLSTASQQVTPDDHSEVVPLLPIPNRNVKRLCADDSGRTSVKVGHRQAFIPKTPLEQSSGVLPLGQRIATHARWLAQPGSANPSSVRDDGRRPLSRYRWRQSWGPQSRRGCDRSPVKSQTAYWH